jgi:hypothetical protein
MTNRRTVLRVEQLGARVLPSATASLLAPTAGAAAAAVSTQTTTGSAWTGQGRFTIATNRTTAAKTYTLEGSTTIGSSGAFAVTGSVTTVGNRTGQATGRVILNSPRGRLIFTVTGPTQSANSGLPSSMTYRIESGTGAFARYRGQGTFKLAPQLFLGYSDRGHFTASATAPVGIPPATKPPVQTTTGTSWHGQGRYTSVLNRTTGVRTYSFEGSANFGSAGHFAVGGSIQTVGNVATGRATGRITLSDRRGTLVLALTGPAQSRNASLPSSYTYRVLSGTGFFARYAGQGTVQLSAPLFPGYTDRGHFEIAVKPTGK